jgi:hypothetical protein
VPRILPLRSLIVSSDMGKLEKAPSFCSTGISYQVKGHRRKLITHIQVNTKKPSTKKIKEPGLFFFFGEWGGEGN